MRQKNILRLADRVVTRRHFLKTMWQALVGSFFVGTGAYTVDRNAEPDQLRVTKVDVIIPDLPLSFDGYCITHLTDLHFGPSIAYQTIKEAFRIADQLASDLIVMTGDFVTTWIEHNRMLTMLHQLSASDGVWAVLGNHDHWVNAAGVRHTLQQAGIIELLNKNTPIVRNDEMLWLAGVDDVWMRQHDLEAALAGIPDEAVVILLAHEPDFADVAAQSGQVALQLSGHSHGGQVNVPISGTPLLSNLVYLAQKYPYGLYDINGMWLYTSAGVGRGPTPRVFASPEVAQLVLRTGQTRLITKTNHQEL
jgi:predicted MPP superfamily phosphohydrolase